MNYCPPIKITIPLPTETVRKRGPQSTSKYGGNFRVRCTNEEYDLVHEEAKHLDISGSMFARCAMVRTAQALRDHRLANSTEEETVGDSGTRDQDL